MLKPHEALGKAKGCFSAFLLVAKTPLRDHDRDLNCGHNRDQNNYFVTDRYRIVCQLSEW
jgi:hypothetical protein